MVYHWIDKSSHPGHEVNYLAFPIHIAKRLIPAAILAAGSMALILVASQWIGKQFYWAGYSTFEENCIRWTFLVAMFFLAALVVFADRISDRTCNGVTAIIFAVFLVHAIYAIWFSVDPVTGSRGYGYESRGPFQYAWMIGAATFGLAMWFFIRKQLSFEGDKNDEQNAVQFSIGSILVWFSIGAAFLSLIQRSSAYPVPTNFKPVTKATWDSIAAVVALLMLPPITNWLMNARRYFRSAACIWINLFAGSWVVFCVIGLTESAYSSINKYIANIAAFSYCTLLYFVWLAVLRRFLVRCRVQWSRSENRSTSSRWIPVKSMTIMARLLAIYAVTWLVLNVAVVSKRRQVSWIDDSPAIMQGFREVFGTQLIE